jgi:hypothetical protein
MAGLVQPGGGRQLAAVVISDGAFDSLAGATLPPAVRFVAVGTPADNRAITVLSAQRPPDGGLGYTAYGRIENKSLISATVTVEALADTLPQPARRLTIPPGGQAELLWPLPVGTARFTVHLSPPDALPLDDTALLFLPVAAQHQVQIRSAQPELYQRVLGGLPGLAAITATLPMTPDLTIIDGPLPASLPRGSLLLVNPQGDWLPVRGTLTNLRPLGGDAPHPLLGKLDLRALLVTKAAQFDVPAWLDTVISSADGPLVLAGTHAGARVVVLSFDPRDSNLPALAAFPLLMVNLIDWLDPLAGGGALQPGDLLPLAPGATVQAPGGQTTRVDDAGVFVATEEVGVYTVARPGRPDLQFAVNMADPQEADLTPRLHPELDRAPDAAAPAPGVPHEIWEPLALIALLLIGADWLVYCWRRGQA